MQEVNQYREITNIPGLYGYSTGDTDNLYTEIQENLDMHVIILTTGFLSKPYSNFFCRTSIWESRKYSGCNNLKDLRPCGLNWLIGYGNWYKNFTQKIWAKKIDHKNNSSNQETQTERPPQAQVVST
jgi:hypothetical protein